LAAGESFSERHLTIKDAEPMDDATADQIEGGGLFVYFFGHVIYQDVFGNEQEIQFCWRLSRDGFEEWGGREHNHRS
jgi:hypothetical protein